jgi:hypothetical protein
LAAHEVWRETTTPVNKHLEFHRKHDSRAIEGISERALSLGFLLPFARGNFVDLIMLASHGRPARLATVRKTKTARNGAKA